MRHERPLAEVNHRQGARNRRTRYGWSFRVRREAAPCCEHEPVQVRGRKRVNSPERAPDPSLTVPLTIAVSDLATAVLVTVGGDTELFECDTAISMDADGRIDLDASGSAIRGFLYAVGDPRGLGLADHRVVLAEDLVAGFVHALMRTIGDLYELPVDARCTLVHPAWFSPAAVDALRDALDYVGLTDCGLTVAASEDVAIAVRAAAPVVAVDDDAADPTASRWSALSSTSARRRKIPTRAAVAVAAAALAFLAIGGAVGTQDLRSNYVETLNSQEVITPSAPVITSQLTPEPVAATPSVEMPPAPVEPEPVYEAPEPTLETFVAPAPVVIPTPAFTLPPIPTVDFPDQLEIPGVFGPPETEPPVTTMSTVTQAPSSTSSAVVTPVTPTTTRVSPFAIEIP